MIRLKAHSFPFEAVRDLLGLVRSLYASAKAQGAGAEDLKKIARVGAMLRESLAMAVQYDPGTMGHAAAWKKADDAVGGLAAMVDVLTPARPIVQAAVQRVKVGRDG